MQRQNNVPNLTTIQDAVNEIKRLIEDAIINGGTDKNGNIIDGCAAKNNLIRSQVPICLIHDAVKSEFVRYGVNPAYIYPPILQHQGELKIFGAVKAKNQDICICPNDVVPTPEILNFDGILRGKRDPYGFSYTERVLSVNVRSQLSSVANNFDTLYERTFAEPLNLHLRCPNMVLGELYMIPVYEYDDTPAQQNRVAFIANRQVKKHIAKYISSFSAVNNRQLIPGTEYKYERVCLLVVDFRPRTPRIYNTDAELIADGLLDANSGVSINNLNYPTFVQTLLNVYAQRFGTGKFI
ncbi:MAG: hypothetical protein IJF46_05585 [Bacteroidaceae bacterium]|nr:hypothetical protein [Bacteroidaceae bacterium]